MEFIVINIETTAIAKRILNALKLLNGVTNASIVNNEDLENKFKKPAKLLVKKLCKQRGCFKYLNLKK